MTLDILFQHIRENSSPEIFLKDLNAYLASEGHTIDDRDNHGNTLLIHASIYHDSDHSCLDIVKILLKNKANINFVSKNGHTALTHSLNTLLKWDSSLAEFLLEQEDINVDIGKNKLFTYLMTIKQNEVTRKIYQSLIRKGVDVEPALTKASKDIQPGSPYYGIFDLTPREEFITTIHNCLYEENRLIPHLPHAKYSEDIARYNQELMMHAVASGMAIEEHTKLNYNLAYLVANYLHFDIYCRFLFIRGFKGKLTVDFAEKAIYPCRRPLLMSAALPVSVETSKKLARPQEEELNNTSSNSPKKQKNVVNTPSL